MALSSSVLSFWLTGGDGYPEEHEDCGVSICVTGGATLTTSPCSSCLLSCSSCSSATAGDPVEEPLSASGSSRSVFITWGWT